MKDKSTLMIRYIGADHARRFIIQRGDFRYWTGDGFSKILDKAQVFHDHNAAGTTVAALQYQRYKGKPIRTFKLELAITLAADNVSEITQAQLEKFIIAAVQMEVDNGLHGDGPVEGSFVQARMKMATLEETVPRRQCS